MAGKSDMQLVTELTKVFTGIEDADTRRQAVVLLQLCDQALQAQEKQFSQRYKVGVDEAVAKALAGTGGGNGRGTANGGRQSSASASVAAPADEAVPV